MYIGPGHACYLLGVNLNHHPLVQACGITRNVTFELIEDIKDGGVWGEFQQFALYPAPVFNVFYRFILCSGGHFQGGITGRQQKKSTPYACLIGRQQISAIATVISKSPLQGAIYEEAQDIHAAGKAFRQ